MNAPTSQTPSPAQTPPPPREVKPLFKWVPWAILGAGVVAVVGVTTRWEHWETGARTQSTDNATVRSESTTLDAQVRAYVKSVNFQDFQPVKRGDVLVELVDDDYVAAKLRAEASLAKARAQLDNLENEVRAQQAVIDQTTASAQASDAKLALAKSDQKRFLDLADSGAVTLQEADTARSTYKSALANSEAARADIAAQQAKLKALQGEEAQRKADVASALAALRTADIDLSHTRIVAPSDGVVGARSVQPGALVTAGTAIVNFVNATPPYVVANFKETQLQRVEPGQAVEVTVDTFPGEVLRAKVTRVSPASGSTFAVLPADNATGNFTKVTQRIPVRIDFEAGQQMISKLRAGMSVEASIDTEQ